MSYIQKKIKAIIKKYSEIKSDLRNCVAYKILNGPDNLHNKFKIQISGTGKIVYWRPSEIYFEDTLLNGFSKDDVKIIAYNACIELNKPVWKIIGHEYALKDKKIFLILKNSNNGVIEKKLITEFLKNKELINSCSQENLILVGYIKAMADSI